MGIVVAVFMLLGWLCLSPWLPRARTREWLGRRPVQRGIGFGLLLTGLWNALWHGLRHADQFWGQAALVSGFLMVMAAILLLGRTDKGLPSSLWSGFAARIRFLQPVVGWLLLACFLLYAVTLVRLNLGYTIWG